jgi:hypothetical protein
MQEIFDPKVSFFLLPYGMDTDKEISNILKYIGDQLAKKLAEETGWHARTAKNFSTKQKTLSKWAKEGPGDRVSFEQVFIVLTALLWVSSTFTRGSADAGHTTLASSLAGSIVSKLTEDGLIK